jgi:hypothetical protein
MCVVCLKSGLLSYDLIAASYNIVNNFYHNLSQSEITPLSPIYSCHAWAADLPVATTAIIMTLIMATNMLSAVYINYIRGRD